MEQVPPRRSKAAVDADSMIPGSTALRQKPISPLPLARRSGSSTRPALSWAEAAGPAIRGFGDGKTRLRLRALWSRNFILRRTPSLMRIVASAPVAAQDKSCPEEGRKPVRIL